MFCCLLVLEILWVIGIEEEFHIWEDNLVQTNTFLFSLCEFIAFLSITFRESTLFLGSLGAMKVELIKFRFGEKLLGLKIFFMSFSKSNLVLSLSIFHRFKGPFTSL